MCFWRDGHALTGVLVETIRCRAQTIARQSRPRVRAVETPTYLYANMEASSDNNIHTVFALCLLHSALHGHRYQVRADEAVAAQVVEEAVHTFF